jgi:hypothetical protein
MRASLLEPELRQAILNVLDCALLIEIEGPRVQRASFVRNGRVNRVHNVEVKEL